MTANTERTLLGEGNFIMVRDYYDRLLDDIGQERISQYDREESGGQCFDAEEIDQGGGIYGFGALDRDKQVAILRAIARNLPTRTSRPNTRTGTSYAIKHAVERYVGFYVSNLQTKTAFRILGYRRSGYQLNPFFNISLREWRAFSGLSRNMADDRLSA